MRTRNCRVSNRKYHIIKCLVYFIDSRSFMLDSFIGARLSVDQFIHSFHNLFSCNSVYHDNTFTFTSRHFSCFGFYNFFSFSSSWFSQIFRFKSFLRWNSFSASKITYNVLLCSFYLFLKTEQVYSDIVNEVLSAMNKSVDPCEDFYLYSCIRQKSKISYKQMQWSVLIVEIDQVFPHSHSHTTFQVETG
jgi:hypothetical protein